MGAVQILILHQVQLNVIQTVMVIHFIKKENFSSNRCKSNPNYNLTLIGPTGICSPVWITKNGKTITASGKVWCSASGGKSISSIPDFVQSLYELELEA